MQRTSGPDKATIWSAHMSASRLQLETNTTGLPAPQSLWNRRVPLAVTMWRMGTDSAAEAGVVGAWVAVARNATAAASVPTDLRTWRLYMKISSQHQITVHRFIVRGRSASR